MAQSGIRTSYPNGEIFQSSPKSASDTTFFGASSDAVIGGLIRWARAAAGQPGKGEVPLKRRIRVTSAAAVLSVGVLLACVVSASAEITGRPFTIDLTGVAEVTVAGVPHQGDPDGSGTATLSINPGTGEVCWTIEVGDVDTVLMAHIHSGASTTTGVAAPAAYAYRSSGPGLPPIRAPPPTPLAAH
jgi:hypothetical protein